MIIKNNKSTIYVKGKTKNDTPYFFIHGFTGSSDSWNAIRKSINNSSFAIDIPGHGKSIFNNIKEKYEFNDWCTEFYLLLNTLNINKINLCGYSMGGRLCLAFANQYPNIINSLILESTSHGIEDLDMRKDRLKEDLELSKDIENNYTSFINEWENNDLFKNQKCRNESEWKLQKTTRLNHNKVQLAKSLDSFGIGSMNHFGNIIGSFNFPIKLISGEEDSKFIKIAHNAMKRNTNVKHYIINDAGHNTHLENPNAFTDVLT